MKSKFARIAGSVAVCAALGTVCSISAIQHVNANDNTTGVVVSLADVKEGSDAFGGVRFGSPFVDYADMQNLLYESNQLAELETSEKQIEQMLSSKKADKKEKAAIEALTATTTEEPVVVVTNSPASTATVSAPAPVVTYADENGTYEYLGEYTLTAYCPCSHCCGIYSNVANPTTASGTRATAGRTIAAPKNFAFGTQLVINGQVYTVEDRGGAIRGNKIDVYFNTHQEAINFGKQTASVYRVVK